MHCFNNYIWNQRLNQTKGKRFQADTSQALKWYVKDHQKQWFHSNIVSKVKSSRTIIIYLPRLSLLTFGSRIKKLGTKFQTTRMILFGFHWKDRNLSVNKTLNKNLHLKKNIPQKASRYSFKSIRPTLSNLEQSKHINWMNFYWRFCCRWKSRF